jgi:hypothetical protein
MAIENGVLRDPDAPRCQHVFSGIKCPKCRKTVAKEEVPG